ncbi:MAG: ParA family protein [Symploca sp. SIO3C6]|nr:ParA family protein [Symploca sp. SIO3C6]
MNVQAIRQALVSLPENASESIVDTLFVPEFLSALGFGPMERVPQYSTGGGSRGGNTRVVDYAVRYNTTEDDTFVETQKNPYLLLELKGKDINLSEGSRHYQSTVKQLKYYLNAENCQSVQWGIITNSVNLQLFRKHGKVVYPSTKCLEINIDNIIEVVKKIREKIENTPRALTVAIYNNKGGVGKTTTTVNLAATLTLCKKKTLIVDFDPNQRDLTNSLGIKSGKETFYSCLKTKNSDTNLRGVIHSHVMRNKRTNESLGFDVIPADEDLLDKSERELRQEIKVTRLYQILNNLKSQYDYILIDSPPNWRFFSVSAVYAADVILIPTKHNNIFSLENAATAIKQYIPEVQEKRQDGGPIALPIFLNGEKITEPQRETAYQAIDSILEKAKREDKFDLTPYFYPRYTQSRRDRHIFDLPSYAHIANAAFSRIPAAYKDRTAREYYLSLAREYFLQ